MSWDNQLLLHVAAASLLRHESGLGARYDESSICIFSCQWDLSVILNYSPTRSGMNCTGQPTFPVGTCRCLHCLPRGWCVTHSSREEQLFCAVSSKASGNVRFTAHTMCLLGHIRTLLLSVISMHLKATEWQVTMYSTRNGHIFHPFISALCSYLSDFFCRPMNKLEST